MLTIIACLCAVASCVFGYLTQKKCKPTSIRYRGQKIEVARKMVAAEVYDAFIKNGQYYARCKVPDRDEMLSVPIDKSMMAAIPDNNGASDVPVTKVLLYQDNGTNGPEYTLTPEEIRFKLNLHVIQDEQQTMDDIAKAANVINFIYEIRLVMWTVAILGVYNSSIISILLSALSAFISYRNAIPLRYCTNSKNRGIISIQQNNPHGTKNSDVPPGFDNWSEDEQYLYTLDKRVAQAKTKASAVDVVSRVEGKKQEKTLPPSDESENNISTPIAQVDETENNNSDSQEDAPFFTDDELAEDSDTGDELSDGNDTEEFDDVEFEDDEFDADADDEDVPDSDDSTEPVAESETPEHIQETKSKATPRRNGKRKKNIQAALEDLIS